MRTLSSRTQQKILLLTDLWVGPAIAETYHVVNRKKQAPCATGSRDGKEDGDSCKPSHLPVFWVQCQWPGFAQAVFGAIKQDPPVGAIVPGQLNARHPSIHPVDGVTHPVHSNRLHHLQTDVDDDLGSV